MQVQDELLAGRHPGDRGVQHARFDPKVDIRRHEELRSFVLPRKNGCVHSVRQAIQEPLKGGARRNCILSEEKDILLQGPPCATYL